MGRGGGSAGAAPSTGSPQHHPHHGGQRPPRASHLLHVHAGLGAGLEEADPMLLGQLEDEGTPRGKGGHGPTALPHGRGGSCPHPTFSAASRCTLRLLSMSHLLPMRSRSTPADAFWGVGDRERGSFTHPPQPSPITAPAPPCPHLLDALHPVLDVLEGFLIRDVVHQDDALRGRRGQRGRDPTPPGGCPSPPGSPPRPPRRTTAPR